MHKLIKLTKGHTAKWGYIQNLNLGLFSVRAKVLHNFTKLCCLLLKHYNTLLSFGALLLIKFFFLTQGEAYKIAILHVKMVEYWQIYVSVFILVL